MYNVQGISISKKNGRTTATLHCLTDFESFYQNSEGRSASGKKCEVLYVGEYDITNIKVGSCIEIFFEKAITLANGGTIQKVKHIEILK